MVVMVVVMVVTPTTVTTVSAAAMTTPRTAMTSVPVMMAVPPSEVLVSTFIKLLQIISHRLKTRPTAMVVVVVMIVMVMMVSSRMPMMISIPPSTVHLSACFELLRIISHCLKMRPTTMVVMMVVIMVMVVVGTSVPMMISIPPGAVQTEVLRIGLNCVHLITDLV